MLYPFNSPDMNTKTCSLQHPLVPEGEQTDNCATRHLFQLLTLSSVSSFSTPRSFDRFTLTVWGPRTLLEIKRTLKWSATKRSKNTLDHWDFAVFFSTLQRPQIWFQPKKFLNGHTPKLSHAYSVTCRDYLFSKFQNWSAPPGISTAGEHVSTIFVPFLFHLKNFFVPFSEMIDRITVWGAGMVPQVTGSNSFFGNFFLRCSPNWPIS